MAENGISTKIHACVEWIFILFAAVYFIAWGLVISILGLLIRPCLTKQKSQRLAQASMHYLLKSYFYGLSLTGLFHLDCSELDRLKNERGILIAPNHPCLMDALFICSRLPNVICVMKASVLRNPILFGGAWLGGFIRSDSAARFVQHCEQTLRDGGQLLLFPEGTRSVNDPINKFKGGFALIAQKSGATVQTVFIHANSQFLGKHWPLWKRPTFPLIYSAKLGDRFQVNPKLNHKVFTKDLESYFKRNLPKQNQF